MKKLSDIVNVNYKFCRSINIRQDISDADILKCFIFPNTFKFALESIVDNITITRQSAFTLTGPYGAGKSSLALLLTSLFGKNKKLREIAKAIVGKELTDKFYGNINIKEGWEIFPIVGDQESVQYLIRNEIVKSKVYKNKDIFNMLTIISERSEGILIIVDEMGKCLEAAAKGIEDIFFYQQLAEFASRSNGKIILIGILHQSFTDYARYLPLSMKDEWVKVQGRFIDIPINTAGEEQIELIGRAIIAKDHNESFIKKVSNTTVNNISRNKVIISKTDLIERYNKCWPINPIVVNLLVQISRKKFGQNQRSIFSFLASGEPGAFREFINTSEYADDLLYMPTDLFEYIRLNLESSIMASSDSRLWHIAIDALSRCRAKGLSEQHLNVFKTIAVIDLFTSFSGIVVDKDLLLSVYPKMKKNIDNIINDLQKMSVIIYKKHTQSYSIYEGSDFDIEAALSDAYSNIIELDILKLDQIAGFKPIIAKRFYHKNGSMRWFNVILTPIYKCQEFLKIEYVRNKALGIFSILLPTTIEEEKTAASIVENYEEFNFPVVFTIASNIRLINEYLRELLAIEWIQKNKGELAGDSVARKIVDERRQILNTLLKNQLNIILNNSYWFYKAEKRLYRNDQLSSLASTIFEEEYFRIPIIKSELVNRAKPSANAVAALTTLMHDMVLNLGIKDLGIEGFTPESSLYNILIKDTGLYKENINGKFNYTESKRNNLGYLWNITDKILIDNNFLSAINIFDKWVEKPFGIKEGLHSFLLLSYILTRIKNVAVYRDGIYIPEVNALFVDYLIKNPKSITLKYIKYDKEKNNILSILIKVINEVLEEQALIIEISPLLVAQKIVAFIDNLQPWVLKTKTLTNESNLLREILKNANDPYKLIFEDLKNIYSDKDMYHKFKSNVLELKEHYSAMIKSFGILITSELDLPLATNAAIERLNERAMNIKGVSGNFLIEAFIARISTFSASYSDIEGLISLANNKPNREWIDLDIENSKKELVQLCVEFKKTELYSKIKMRPNNRQAIAFITGIGGRTNIVSREFDILIDKKNEVNQLKKQLEKLISKEKDVKIILTALAETSIDYLEKIK